MSLSTFGEAFKRNINLFSSEKLKQDVDFVPFGTKIYEYSREPTDDKPLNSKFEIYKVDSSMSEFESQKFVFL